METYRNFRKYKNLGYSILLKALAYSLLHSQSSYRLVLFGYTTSVILMTFSILLIVFDGLFYIDNILYYIKMKDDIEVRVGKKKTRIILYKKTMYALLLNTITYIVFASFIARISIIDPLMYNLISGCIFVLLCRFLKEENTNRVIVIYIICMLLARFVIIS